MKRGKIRALFEKMTGCYGCQHTEQLLFDYVEGGLDPEQTRKLRDHLGDCPECLEFVATYRKTLSSTHERDLSAEVAMPTRLREKLEQFIATNPDFK